MDGRGKSSTKVSVMILLRMPLTVPLLIVIFSSGVGAQAWWDVTYSPKYICALKGSTVTMGCTYSYPSGHIVQTTFWTKCTSNTDSNICNLSADPAYTGRVQYLGDKISYCSLSLSSVTENDQWTYFFRFITSINRWLGSGGITLSVTGLQVMVPGKVMEGNSVILTCKTTCSLTNSPLFTWYINNNIANSTGQLYLQSVSSKNADRYSCGVLGQDFRSPEVTLNVLYGPKNVSVSISPSGKIVEGSSVTLTCNSDGNPPVQKYTWYKETSLEESRQTFTMNNVSSVNSGDYKCKSSNEHGEKYSDPVTLNVLYPPKSVSVSISPSSVVKEGSLVNLTCSSDGNPPVEYTWFKGSSSVATGNIFTLNNISSVNSGEYRCRSSNERGDKYSDTVTLNVLYPPKNVSVSISPSGEIVEGSSVNLTCSSDGNPPVQKYTWFKKVDKGLLQKWTGQIYSITNITSADSGDYQCMTNNTQGSRSSQYKPLNVSYAPKNVSISEIALDGSVTLTCSSDGIPPVQNYTWFKEGGGSSPVGYSNSYSAVQSGSYYCVAQNRYGSRTAAAVPVTVKASTNTTIMYAVVGVAIGTGCFFVVIAVLCLRRKRQKKDAADAVKQKQEHIYNNEAAISAATKATDDSDPANEDGLHYASITHPKNSGSPAVNVSSLGTEEKVEYASVQHRRNEVVENNEDGLQYSSLQFTRTGASDRPATKPHEDLTVIYSRVN